MSNYFIHPATCIQFCDSRYYLKNAMVGKAVPVDQLKDIAVSDQLIDCKVFYPMTERKEAGAEMLEYLEKHYALTRTEVGYIETTSICPYKCKMCPKHSNKIERRHPIMPMELYRSIIDQMSGCNKVTLHLFGDPFCDSKIMERIRYANQKGIKPSFSTNLIALDRSDLNELSDMEIEDITISFDATSAEEMTEIRGKTTTEQFNKGLRGLKQLAQLQEKHHFAESITLQSIDMKNTEKVQAFIESIIEEYNQLSFFRKPFIVFPGMTDSDLKHTEQYCNNEWLWIYDLLGEKKPYRCLKPWNKSESGIMSDGQFVPCCMCYNVTKEIGNISSESLADILNGRKYNEFRKRIFHGEDCGVVCNSCTTNGELKHHTLMQFQELEHLKEHCINQW